MTFSYTDPDGDRLHVTPTRRFGEPAISLRNARADIPQGAAVHIPLDRVEEVIAGLRDTARQAAGESSTCPSCTRTSYHPLDRRYGYCGHCHDYTGTPEGETGGRG